VVVLRPEMALVGGHDRPADREPEPEAVDLRRHEGLEHLAQVRLEDADAAIGNGNDDGARSVSRLMRLRTNRQPAIRLRLPAHRLGGVHQEIYEYLLELDAVAEHRLQT